MAACSAPPELGDRDPTLPLFPDHEPARHRVPLLEIMDASGLPLRNRGKGAPLEARVVVRGGLLMVRPEDRGREYVRVAVSVGELLDGLYPTKRRPSQHWPQIEAALRRARDFTITDADGGRWFPMALRRLPPDGPSGYPDLRDLVLIDLAPPPGMAGSGSPIDLPALDRMGVKSGPQWRAYIAARTLVWVPGKTRRPVPRAPGQFTWSGGPDDYPVLTLDDLRLLAFGDDGKHRDARGAGGALGGPAGRGCGARTDRPADRHTRLPAAARGGRRGPAPHGRNRGVAGAPWEASAQPGSLSAQPGKIGALIPLVSTKVALPQPEYEVCRGGSWRPRLAPGATPPTGPRRPRRAPWRPCREAGAWRPWERSAAPTWYHGAPPDPCRRRLGAPGGRILAPGELIAPRPGAAARRRTPKIAQNGPWNGPAAESGHRAWPPCITTHGYAPGGCSRW